MAQKETPAPVDQQTGAVPKVKWDDANMQTAYANVCNVASTREEVTLLFGTNQTWHGQQDEVCVRLSDRIILSPYAAKRLAMLLASVVGEYEKRFGSLGVTRAAAGTQTTAAN